MGDNKKLFNCKCEICGCKFKSQNKLMNGCDNCFNEETDIYVERNRKDLEGKGKIYNKIKKN